MDSFSIFISHPTEDGAENPCYYIWNHHQRPSLIDINIHLRQQELIPYVIEGVKCTVKHTAASYCNEVLLWEIFIFIKLYLFYYLFLGPGSYLLLLFLNFCLHDNVNKSCY